MGYSLSSVNSSNIVLSFVVKNLIYLIMRFLEGDRPLLKKRRLAYIISELIMWENLITRIIGAPSWASYVHLKLHLWNTKSP